jgi:hypothetical protein
MGCSDFDERIPVMFSMSLINVLDFAAADGHCLAYGGLSLAHALAAALSWHHHQKAHATVYACSGSLYGWLCMLSTVAS